METVVCIQMFIDFEQFKSYYVVWKLGSATNETIIQSSLNRTMQYGNNIFSYVMKYVTKFKSYYVVWKRSPATEVFPVPPQFKSYYVVWKLQFADDMPIMHEMRLNRTMQYGNGGGLKEDKENKQLFKSYYVVWKPFSHLLPVKMWQKV